MTTHAFTSSAYIGIDTATSLTDVYLEPAVPEGKLLIIEHVSGSVVVKDGYGLDHVAASGIYREVYHTVFLPVHFASQATNYWSAGGTAIGMTRKHQFGSPCRLYVSAGERVYVSATAYWTADMSVSAIGYLENA